MSDVLSGELLVVTQALNPVQVYGDGGADAIVARVRAEALAAAQALDISTPKGRKDIASLAFKVARSKTALDDMGKTLAADWKAKAAAVDADRRKIRDALDEVKDLVRKPLTEFENADKARIQGHEDALAAIAGASVFVSDPTLAEIAARKALVIDYEGREWQEFQERAAGVKRAAYDALELRRQAVVRAEAERAEALAAGQAEAARLQAEREARIASEAAAQASQAAERERQAAETRAKEAEAAQIRAETERRNAIDREKRAQEAKRAAQEGAKADAKAAAEKALQRERERIAAETAREQVAADKREASERNRRRITKAISAALVEAGLTAQQADLALDALVAGKVPHVKIEW